jgi:hypothetical protein
MKYFLASQETFTCGTMWDTKYGSKEWSGTQDDV